MRVVGLYQAYEFESVLGVDSNNPEDMDLLSQKVGDVSKFQSISSALSYGTQIDVFNEINALLQSDSAFQAVWSQRQQEIDKFNAMLYNMNKPR
jgi:hypothetical protein